MRIGLQAWGSEGDISPFLALAGGLVRDGHHVTLVVTDNAGRDYSHYAREGGFTLVTVPLPAPALNENMDALWREIIEVGNPLRQAELVLRHGYDPVADAMLAAAIDLVDRSDAVVGHFFAYPLQIAAERVGTPAATLAIVHNCVPTNTRQAPGLPDLGPWSHRWGWLLARGIVNRIFLPRYNRQRERLRMAPIRDTMTQAWASSRLNLIAVSPSICERPHDWAAKHVVTGFINEVSSRSIRPLSESLQTFLDAGEPPLFIGFGSMMPADATDYARQTVDIVMNTVCALDTRAVLQLPDQLLGLAGCRDSVHAVSWADYRLLFPRCSIIVHHGGAGTVQSALRAGRPSIVIAHVSDQFFWGEELERLRVAGPTQRRKGLSAAALRDAVRATMLNRSLAPNADRLGQSMSKENGVEAAVRAVNALAERILQPEATG
jgi:UDP:flavonoid glycosyltransferase YjiC (YdhE family)